MIGLEGAGHAEYDPGLTSALIAPVACEAPDRYGATPRLHGRMCVAIRPGSAAHGFYREPVAWEEFVCNYELNPEYAGELERAGMRITGRGNRGEVRIVELPGHRFFVATLFLPQAQEAPHPLILAYLEAASRFQEERNRC